jgi:serine/threonine protein phosphatase 1
MIKRFVIGDVHGCCKTLIALIEQQLMPSREDAIYFLGDYIDRGPDSKGVIDYILQLQFSGYNIHTLMGNHEHFLLRSKVDNALFRSWKKNGGGNKALQSFGIIHPNNLDEKYLHFFENLKSHIVLYDAVLVHAGINCEQENPYDDFVTLLYTRNTIYDAEKLNNRKVIHGHTPVTVAHIHEQLNNQSPVIDLDSGCVYFKREGLGNLSSLELNSQKLFIQKNIDN